MSSNTNNANKSKKTQQEKAAKARAKARAELALQEEQAFYDETDNMDESDYDFIDDMVNEDDKAKTVTFPYMGRKITATHAESLPYEFLSIAGEEETSKTDLGMVRLMNYFLKNAISPEDRAYFMTQSPKAVTGLWEKWNRVCGAKKKG